MEEIDILRIKNQNLIEKLKLGQSKFRTLVSNSDINISSEYIEPLNGLNSLYDTKSI